MKTARFFSILSCWTMQLKLFHQQKAVKCNIKVPTNRIIGFREVLINLTFRPFFYHFLTFMEIFHCVIYTSIHFFMQQMQVQNTKYQGLVADLLPNIRLMQGFGHFIFKYVTGPILIRKIYSFAHLALLAFNFGCILANLAANTDEVSELTCKKLNLLLFRKVVKSSII